MKPKKHPILNHPILGYFVLIAVTFFFSALGLPLDALLAKLIPGYASQMTYNGMTIQMASGVGFALGSLLALLVFKLRFRPDFRGCLSGDYIVQGILIMLPALLVHWIGSAVSWITFGTGSVLIAFLRAFANLKQGKA